MPKKQLGIKYTCVVCDKPPFQVTETGWGEFAVQIRIQFITESAEKPLLFAHTIKLHHWGPPIEAPNPVPTNITESTANDPINQGKEGMEEIGKDDESKTQQADLGTVTSSPNNTDAVPISEPPSIETPIPSLPVEAHQPSQPISIAVKYPVYAWKYDEIVFSDPPSAFLSILNAYPPTPLPSKNRRSRDQREVHEERTGKRSKGRKGTSTSRQGTTEPQSVDAPSTGEIPSAGNEVVIGIPGERASADMPLEFTQEMEKGEWGRLNDARLKIVAEMDKWR